MGLSICLSVCFLISAPLWIKLFEATSSKQPLQIYLFGVTSIAGLDLLEVLRGQEISWPLWRNLFKRPLWRDLFKVTCLHRSTRGLEGNQVGVVAVSLPQLTQASFLQKKSNVAKSFFDICNTEMAQSLCSLQNPEFLKLIVFIFHVKKLNNKCELAVRVIPCNF